MVGAYDGRRGWRVVAFHTAQAHLNVALVAAACVRDLVRVEWTYAEHAHGQGFDVAKRTLVRAWHHGLGSITVDVNIDDHVPLKMNKNHRFSLKSYNNHLIH